jgi:type I restriction enzyme S subunit
MKEKLGNYIKEISVRNKLNEDIPVYSVTNTEGFCKNFFNKDVTSNNKSNYKIVPKGYFAYNPSRINVGSIDWLRNEDKVLVSPLYNVFYVSEELNKQYLYYYLKSDIARQQIKFYATGSVRDNLKLSALYEFRLNIPSIEKQKSIINKLNKIVSLIELKQKQLTKLDELVKARFVEMFGDPTFNNYGLPFRSLKNLGSWKSGGTPPRSNPAYFEGSIDWYSAGELNSLFLKDSVEKITAEAINKSSAKLFPSGSLLVGMYDTAAFKMGILQKESSCNQACACIIPSNKINVIFLYFELELMKNEFLKQRRGVRQKNLNLGMIKDFEVPYPSLELQNQFADFVKQVDKSKFEIQKSIDETQMLFDSLMQKYFG